MCGIICYIGDGDTKNILIDGLHRLEYRGYDSAGLAIRVDDSIECHKSVGRIHNLENRISSLELNGNLGIAHTRWATHGAPTTINAHPHTDVHKKVFVVHNGILENYNELKKDLKARKIKLKSETDTELLAQLISIEFTGDLLVAVKNALKRVKGTFGIAVIHEDVPDKIIVARRSSSIIIGLTSDGVIVASDVTAIARHTNKIIQLEDEEIAVLTKDDFYITNLDLQPVVREPIKMECDITDVDIDGYPHFMLKEIFEQPNTISQAFKGRLDFENSIPMLGGLQSIIEDVKSARNLIIVSCGTSYYAAMVGKYIFEQFTNLDIKIELASEFRYSNLCFKRDTLVLFISQSGETADTYVAVKEAKRKGLKTLGIVNVVSSSIAKETDAGIYIRAGMEIGVASTKCFTSQLVILTLMALFIGRHNILTNTTAVKVMNELIELPSKVQSILDNFEYIKKLAEKYYVYNNWLFLGRKYNYPIALEGALKLKEISYIHAEGYAAGEMKHGPIALISKNVPSFFMAPKDDVYDKIISNINEVKSRNGLIIVVATEGDSDIKNLTDDVIYIPETLDVLYPILTAIPCQLMAYYCAAFLNRDIDKPRNLAKSVTVE